MLVMKARQQTYKRDEIDPEELLKRRIKWS